MEQLPLSCKVGGVFFGSSVLRFFGPSVLRSFRPSVLRFFRTFILPPFRPSVIPSRRCRRCLIIASCSYQWTSSVALECGIYFIVEAHLQANSTSLTLIVIHATTLTTAETSLDGKNEEVNASSEEITYYKNAEEVGGGEKELRRTRGARGGSRAARSVWVAHHHQCVLTSINSSSRTQPRSPSQKRRLTALRLRC